MAAEIDALEANNTRKFTALLLDKRAIRCKWVYKIKYNVDGPIECHKARLVVLGNHQIEGDNFHKTFALVTMMDTVRCLLVFGASKGCGLHQTDAHNTFLHSDLYEDVYMKLPPGFYTLKPSMGCKL